MELKQLINRGANINAVTKYDMRTPLIIACKNKNVSLVNFLLQNGANVALTGGNGWTALHVVVDGFNDSLIMELMLMQEVFTMKPL